MNMARTATVDFEQGCLPLRSSLLGVSFSATTLVYRLVRLART